MDVKSGSSYPLSVALGEMVGTMFFSMIVNLARDPYTIGLGHAVCILMTYEISGGHLNPAVSIGVYIKSRKFYGNFLFLLFTMLAQLIGALIGLAFAFLLRVQQTIEDTDIVYMTPDLNSFSPPILISTDGKPSYG